MCTCGLDEPFKKTKKPEKISRTVVDKMKHKINTRQCIIGNVQW